MAKKDNLYIEKLENHIEKSNLNLKYSIDRFDILIISISSGGLVFSMGFVKDLLVGEKIIDFFFLKISWTLFALSIILNLLSQVTGYYANRFEIKISKNLIRKEKGKTFIGNQSKFEIIQKLSNILTTVFNGLSLLFCVSAIIILVIFMSLTLKNKVL